MSEIKLKNKTINGHSYFFWKAYKTLAAAHRESKKLRTKEGLGARVIEEKGNYCVYIRRWRN